MTAALSLGLFGQQYAFVPHTPPGAAPDSSTLVEDAAGALWLGSTTGVFRYDGTRFHQISFPSGRELPVHSLAASADGSIWVGAKPGFYHVVRGVAHKLADGQTDSVAVSGEHVAFLERVTGAQGAVRHALGIVQRVSGSYRVVRHDGIAPNRFLTFDQEGNLLFTCASAICEIKRDEVAVASPHVQRTEVTGLPGGWDIALRDRSGCLWLRNAASVAYRCPSETRFTALPAHLTDQHILAPVYLDRENRIWLPSERGVLSYGRPGAWRTVRRDNDLPRSINTVTQLRDGTVWLHGSGGLMHWANREHLEYWTERQGAVPAFGFLHHRGQMFTAGFGLMRLAPDRSRWQPFGDLSVYSYARHVIPGPDGSTLQVALWRNGIAELDLQGRTIRRPPQPPLASMVRLEREGNQVWAAGAGLYLATPKPGQFEFQQASLPPPFQNGLDLDRDSQGRVWHCSDAGLFRQERARGMDVWKRWTTDDGLLENGCRSLAVTPDGKRLWYGYNQVESFTRFDFDERDVAQVRHFRKQDGFGGGYYLDYDQRGWLWRGFDHQYVSDGQHFELDDWIKFSKNDGMLLEGSNQQGFYADPDGSVWFAADENVYHYKVPSDLFTRQVEPSFFFANDLSKQSFNYGEPVELQFGSLYYERRNQLRFRYRTSPDEAWRTTSDFSATLRGLGDGRHRVEASARVAPQGKWTAPVTWEFTVLPPLWRQPRVLGAASGGLGLIAVGVLGRRSWRRYRHQRQKDAFLAAMREEQQSTGDAEIDRLLRAARDGQSFPDPSPVDARLRERHGVINGRFELEQAVATGGFAAVYRARDLARQGAASAVKIFHVNEDERAWMLRRFAQEIAALERIAHPNVVSFLAAGETETGEPYLAMEFVEGTTLRAALHGGPFSAEAAARAARELGEALAAIHAQGVIHRDIKPENLMLTPEGRLRVIDFSIAIARDPRATVHALSRAAGSLMYMAPEQVFGYASAGTDIYSFALVVFELLTGEGAGQLGLGATSGALAPEVEAVLKAKRPELPPATLLLSALTLDVQSRPRDAADFGRRLAEWILTA